MLKSINELIKRSNIVDFYTMAFFIIILICIFYIWKLILNISNLSRLNNILNLVLK